MNDGADPGSPQMARRMASLTASDTLALLCRIDIALPPLSLSSLVRRGRGSIYRIGRTGPVAFSIQRHGMFAAHGQAARANGWLSLNSTDGAIAAIDLEVDPASVSVRWTEMVAGERPVHRLPRLHFRSLASLGATRRTSPGAARDASLASSLASSLGTGAGTASMRGILRGLLDIDTVPRLQTMDVTVLDRARDSITGTEIVSYRLDGEIDLASFATTPERSLLGDTITVTARMDVELSPGD